MKLYNTLSRTKEDFKPLNPPEVKMYTCGPTVYSYITIGNFRAYVTADILRRVLEFNNYKVNYVMNVTDVGHLVSDADTGEDKLEKGARREGKSPLEIAHFYEKDFIQKSQELNFLEPNERPRASEHVGEMIKLIERLERKGYIYITSTGVYFDVSKFVNYEKLARCDLKQQMQAAREDVVADETKKNPCDFRLWQLNQPEHILQWDSPWGRGYPGWHIECSAMSMKYLDEQMDIHTGGEDLIFPHHTNEIAQSEAATGKQYVKYWVHNAFLLVDGGRMGKSLGNAYTIDDIKKRGFEPLALRYFYLTAHYRSPLNFTWEALQSAQNGYRNLRGKLSRLQLGSESGSESESESVHRCGTGSEKDHVDVIAQFSARFQGAINDDLDTPRAMAVLWEMVKAEDLSAVDRLSLAEKWDKVLGLDLLNDELKTQSYELKELPEQVQKLISQREELRENKEFVKADGIRERLQGMGYRLEDTPENTEITAS
ncbi:cysteine--tRNA ligase [Patescibacteria group bacterium]|nr:cysteine--tRNA ligase [Patescibacteria group bacterium]